MTRLTAEHIRHIESSCEEWDRYLKSAAGLSLLDIAARVSGSDVSEIEKIALNHSIYVVPVTAGQGRIEYFSESVCAIIKTMGFRARVSAGSDVEGLYEARRNGADIVFMADDNRYIAVNLKNGKIAENNTATARGYTELLNACVNKHFPGRIGLKEVLLIGYGFVGKEIAVALTEKNAEITVYDKEAGKLNAAKEDGYKTIDNIEYIKNFSLIADASSEGGWLTCDLLPDTFFMAAPGIPLSLDLPAQDKHKGRFFFDTLEIGTAAMLGMAV